jgi:hypothetical protein
MDGAVGQRLRQCVIDETVLIDPREVAEARGNNGDVEVIARAGAVDDAELACVGERSAKERFESLCHESDDTSR